MRWVPTIMMGLAGGYIGWVHLEWDIVLLGLFTYVAGVIRGNYMAQEREV